MSKLAKYSEPRFVGSSLIRAVDSDHGVSFQKFDGVAWIEIADNETPQDDFFFTLEGTPRFPATAEELAAMGLTPDGERLQPVVQNVKPIIPGSPEDKAQSLRFAQEFVDNLNRNVLKEELEQLTPGSPEHKEVNRKIEELNRKIEEPPISSEPTLASKPAKTLKEKLEEAGEKPSNQHGAVILPQRPPFKGPEINIPTRKATLDTKTGVQKPTAFLQFFRMLPWGLLGVIVLALLLILFLIDRVVLMRVEARCLEAGYANAKVAWYINGYEGYCVGQGYVIPAPNFKR